MWRHIGSWAEGVRVRNYWVAVKQPFYITITREPYYLLYTHLNGNFALIN